MRSLRSTMRRLLGLWTSRGVDSEIHAELESHCQLQIDDGIRAGLPPDEARRRTQLALGGFEATKDHCRDQRAFAVLDALRRDGRHGLRLLARSPGFTLTAVLILGLGIGVNAAIFSVVNAVVLRPLPFPDSSRVVQLWHTPPPEQFGGRRTFAVSPANYLDWQAQSASFERMAIYGFRPANFTGRGEPDALVAAAVSGEFFRVLGVTGKLGRLLDSGDAVPGKSHVVVLSEKSWNSRFGADPTVVGQTIRLNGEPYTVVGVLAQRFKFPDWPDLWMPLVWTPQESAVRGNHNYLSIGRLRAGADVRTAQAEMSTISQRLEQQYPADDKGWGALVMPLQENLVANVRVGLLVLLGAVACVLLIACANLGNLLLARALGRGKEIAIRTAVGASRGRIVQQLLVESTLLGLAGGAVGLAAAAWSISLIVNALDKTLPRVAEINLDGRVLAFTCVIAALTGLVAGVAPAWRMTRGEANDALKQGMGRGGSHAGERRVRNGLVISEVALALMLLVGAGLLIRTLWQLRAVDPGIDARNVVTMTVRIPRTRYAKPEQSAQFFAETFRRVRALPGVESAAGIDDLPLDNDGSTQPVAIEGEPPRPLSEQPEIAIRNITTGYLSTVRMRVLEGRDFSEADQPGRPPVVLVSASTARRFWPNDRAVGKRLTLGLMSNDAREVVGVVSDVKLHGLNVSDVQTIYTPFGQAARQNLSLVVRAAAPDTIVQPIVAAVHAVDAEQPVIDIRTMDEVIGASITQHRFVMALLTGFAALALMLAAIGIYGVLSYTVRQRVREIGVRMALGADTRDVVRLVLVEGMKPTLLGVGLGIAGASAISRVLTTFLYGIGPRDIATMASVSLVVILVAVAATAVPAYRATRVNPLQALRAE